MVKRASTLRLIVIPDRPELPALLMTDGSGCKSPGRAHSFHGKSEPRPRAAAAPNQGILPREFNRGQSLHFQRISVVYGKRSLK